MEISDLRKMNKTELIEYAKEAHSLDLDINDHSKENLVSLIAEYEGKSESMTSSISEDAAVPPEIDQEVESEPKVNDKRAARQAARAKKGPVYPRRIGENVKQIGRESLSTG